MGTPLESVIRSYLSVADWFIPEQLRTNPLILSRARNLVGAAVIAIISDPFYALLYYLVGFTSATPEILICGALMVSAPFLLKLTGRIKFAEELFVCALYFNFCWLTYHLGGVDAPTAPWLIICPVVAILLGGVATGIFWLILSCAAVLVFYFFQVFGIALPLVQITHLLLLRLVVGIGLFIVVVSLVLYFEFTKTQGMVKLEQALKIIQELALRDELTGIYNRRHILNRVAAEKERADRLATPFCVCLLDIDHFKRINDTYGHSAGDTVLRTFAEVVQRNIRNVDSFGRYGGEEFLVVFPQTDLDEVMALAERVRAEIERVNYAHLSTTLTITVSIGIARYQSGENIEQTIANADIALYKAKSGGRNFIVRHGCNDMNDKCRNMG